MKNLKSESSEWGKFYLDFFKDKVSRLIFKFFANALHAQWKACFDSKPSMSNESGAYASTRKESLNIQKLLLKSFFDIFHAK